MSHLQLYRGGDIVMPEQAVVLVGLEEHADVEAVYG